MNCKKCGKDVEKLAPSGICEKCIKEGAEKKKKGKKVTMECPVCGGVCEQSNMLASQIVYKCDCGRVWSTKGEEVEIPWYPDPDITDIPDMTPHQLRDLFTDVVHYVENNVILPQEEDYIILALWCISTYKIDKFDTTGYFGFYASGNEKGKTRGLKVIKELAYRAVLTKPTKAFVSKALTDGATILIDQAENTFFDGKRRTEIYDIWTSGYQRNIKMGMLNATDNVSYRCKETFGAKATSMQEESARDNAINSRTISVYMQQGIPKNKHLDIETPIELRKKLYKFKQMDISFNKNTWLTGRPGDVCDPLIFTARMLSLPETVIERVYKFAIDFKYKNVDEQHNTTPARVYYAIEELLSVGQFEIMSREISAKMKEMYADTDESKYYSPSKISKYIVDFGFKISGHRNNGNYYDIGTQENAGVLEKIRTQYMPDSILFEVEKLKKELINLGGENINVGGDVKEQLIRLHKYSELMKTAYEIAMKNAENNIGYIPDIELDSEPELLSDEEEYLRYLESIAPDEPEHETDMHESEQDEPEHQCPCCHAVLPGLEKTLCEACQKIYDEAKTVV